MAIDYPFFIKIPPPHLRRFGTLEILIFLFAWFRNSDNVQDGDYWMLGFTTKTLPVVCSKKFFFTLVTKIKRGQETYKHLHVHLSGGKQLHSITNHYRGHTTGGTTNPRTSARGTRRYLIAAGRDKRRYHQPKTRLPNARADSRQLFRYSARGRTDPRASAINNFRIWGRNNRVVSWSCALLRTERQLPMPDVATTTPVMRAAPEQGANLGAQRGCCNDLTPMRDLKWDRF